MQHERLRAVSMPPSRRHCLSTQQRAELASRHDSPDRALRYHPSRQRADAAMATSSIVSSRCHGQSVALWSTAPIVIFAFLLEGIVAKSNIPMILMTFVRHMSITLGLLGAMLAIWSRYRVSDFHGTKTPELNRIRHLIMLMSAWALLSCVVQTDGLMAANVAFWCMWTVNLLVMWWVAPVLVYRLGLRSRIRLLFMVLVVVAVACCLLHRTNGFQQGRFVGMFINATYSGRMLAIGTIFSFTLWLTGRRQPHLRLLVTVLCGALLVMTRTRASIAAGSLGCAVVYLTVQLSARHWQNGSTRQKSSTVAVVGLLLIIAGSQIIDARRAAAFLRVEGGVEGVLASREMNWGGGYGEFSSYGYFGEGFMSRFGNASNPRIIAGIAFPRYDWQTADDPLNMWVSMAKQSGIPAMCFLALLVAAIWRMANRLPDSQARCLLRGLLTAGLVFGSLDGNWLLSFGDPVDRFCLMTFAMLGSASAEANPNRARRHRPTSAATSQRRQLNAAMIQR